MKEIAMKATEMDEIKVLLEDIIERLENVSSEQFSSINASPFYLDGNAKEEVNRLLAVKKRSQNENFSAEIIPDYYGKIQSLLMYYSLLMQYCLDAMMAFQDKDQEIKKLIEKYQAEVIAED